MTITDKLNSTYIQLLRDLQNDQFANASERALELIKLPDGRNAQLTLKIETDDREWM